MAFALCGCGRLGFDSQALVAGADAGFDASSTSDASPGTSDTFGDLCAFDRYTIIENGLPEDDVVGAMLASRLTAACGNSATTAIVSQDEPSAVDPGSGRPLLSPDELVILGGGDGPHRVVRYLLRSDTPIVWSGANPVTFEERSSGRTIVTGPTSSDHDYAFLQVVREPIGGTLALSAQGITANGTAAAAQWFDREIAPAIATRTFGWVIVEWTDSDGTGGPGAADDFAVIESR